MYARWGPKKKKGLSLSVWSSSEGIRRVWEKEVLVVEMASLKAEIFNSLLRKQTKQRNFSYNYSSKWKSCFMKKLWNKLRHFLL